MSKVSRSRKDGEVRDSRYTVLLRRQVHTDAETSVKNIKRRVSSGCMMFRTKFCDFV
jgi:hypothetical protein